MSMRTVCGTILAAAVALAATVKADFDDPPSLRKGFVEAFVQAKVFADPGEFRFTVRPVGFFVAIGEALVCAETFRK